METNRSNGMAMRLGAHELAAIDHERHVRLAASQIASSRRKCRASALLTSAIGRAGELGGGGGNRVVAGPQQHPKKVETFHREAPEWKRSDHPLVCPLANCTTSRDGFVSSVQSSEALPERRLLAVKAAAAGEQLPLLL
jgi:hypothetical protein